MIGISLPFFLMLTFMGTFGPGIAFYLGWRLAK